VLQTEIRVLRNGKKIRLAQKGTGPVLVFLHGYPDNLQIWSQVIDILASEYQCIALDWPGMGESEAWSGGAAPKQMAERLRLILSELGFDTPTIIALDMGGQAALEYAARYPEYVRNLIVMNSLVFGDEETSWEIQVLRKYGWNRWLLRNFPRVVFFRARRTFLSVRSSLPTEIASDLWKSFRRNEVRQFISRMCAGYEGSLPNLPLRYSKIKCPTLILWGEQDKHFPISHAQRLHKAVSGSELEILAGAWHWMIWEHADRVADSANRFLQSWKTQVTP